MFHPRRAMLILLVTLVLVSTIPQVSSISQHLVSRPGLQRLFSEWKESFQKEYDSAEELASRMEIWLQNHFFIEEHNRRNPAPVYRLGHNQFSDLTLEEFREVHRLGDYSPGILGDRPVPKVSLDHVLTNPVVARRLQDLPDQVDWVQQGAVTPVKNQGMCGSCWAFSAIGAIEGARYLETGELISLSEQQLIDCDFVDRGCFGGLMDNAFAFDENSTGICSEEDYPYAGHRHWITGCAETKQLCDDVSHTRITTFIDVNQTNTDLMEAIVIQPVSIAIEADQPAFQFYKSGVFDADCGVDVDHAVLAVGYGTENDIDFWLVKNSWGESWGDSGYIKLARNTNTTEGMCGILTFASRPIIDS